MLSVLSLVFTGCKDYEADRLPDNTGEGVSLAFDVSTQPVHTRMSEDATKGDNRGLLDLYLFPFDVRGKIGSGAVPLSGSVADMNWETFTYHRYGNRSVDIANGTASFLCYAKAEPVNSGDYFVNYFVNGAISPVISKTSKPAEISFSPKQIHSVTTADESITAIADYLTSLAKAIPQDKRDFFYQFVNEGRPVAASSANAAAMKEWVKTWATSESLTLTLPDDITITDYPESISLPDGAAVSLPDGAAVVKWNYSQKKFEPVTETTTEANINSLSRFVYPAELYYYANSRIKTSATGDMKAQYSYEKWADVLKKYENDDAVTDMNSRSVAIKDPLSYAVGRLQIGIVAKSTLEDADGTTITLSNDETFPLTAVLVAGQYQQAFDFTPKDDNSTEYIIYDKEVSGQSMGKGRAANLSTTAPAAYTNTLVLQSKDQSDVRFALEFTNNSGQDIQTLNGRVLKGTKFYLVGTIEVPSGQTDDYKKRAFTKGYDTQGVVRISSLKDAYPYLPNLLEPRLEIGIKLIPNWIQSTTTNVPL